MNKSFAAKMLEWSPFPAVILVVVFTVISAVISPFFLSTSYLPSFIGAYIPLIILSMGQFVVLVTGGIDISIGAIMTIVNVVIVHMIGLGVNPFLAFLFGGIVGVLFGCLNGFIVSVFRVNPMLVTLATTSIASGGALAIMPAPGGSVPVDYVMWYQKSFAGIPAPAIFVAIVLAVWLIIYFSPLGIRLFAIGENMKMAYVSAIKVRRVQFSAYVFAGFAAAIAGIAVSGSIGSGSASVGLSLTLNSVAACVIGDISLAGGKGSIAGAILGSVFLGLVFNIVISVNMSPFYQSLVSGVIVLGCIVGTSALTMIREKNNSLKKSKDVSQGGVK